MGQRRSGAIITTFSGNIARLLQVVNMLVIDGKVCAVILADGIKLSGGLEAVEFGSILSWAPQLFDVFFVPFVLCAYLKRAGLILRQHLSLQEIDVLVCLSGGWSVGSRLSRCCFLCFRRLVARLLVFTDAE